MPKKKTHEEYKNELKKINPNIIPDEEYINSNTSIWHKCLIDGYRWKTSPNKILSLGRGCPMCGGSARKTTDEYKKELSVKNSNLEVCEEYINMNTPILHHCIKHDILWKISPASALRGCGCEKCKSEKIISSNSKTHEEYVQELSYKNPFLKVDEQYIDALTPILHTCLIHDYEWKISPSSALKGTGCYYCGCEKLSKLKTKSNEQYKKDLEKVNPNIVPDEDYVNSSTPIFHRCLVDGYRWKIRPGNALSGKGCPMCAGNIKTTEQYKGELEKVNPNIIPEENYINANTPILHKCLVDNYKWKVTPSDTLRGRGCPHCKIKKFTEFNLCTTEQYKNKLKDTNPNIIVEEDYINSVTPIFHRCLVDGYRWKAKPVNIIAGCGCPHCHESKGERRIRIWLDKHKILYEFQYKDPECIDINCLPFDFYLPTYKKMIEYDGLQHFKPVKYFGGIDALKITQKHDNIKNDFCKNNGILLLRIPYYKYKNIEEELDNFLFN